MTEDRRELTPPDSAGEVSSASAQGASARTGRSRWSFAKKAAVTAMSVFALAAVILGIAAISDPANPEDGKPGIEGDSKLSERSYDAALDALASGDTSRAITLLERAVLFDGTNTLAKNRLEKVKTDSQRPVQPGSNDAPPDDPPAPDSAFMAEVDPLAKLLPSSAQGYSFGSRVGDAPDVTVSARPVGPPGVVTLAVWAVHDRKTAKGAADFITNTSKKAYSKDGASVTIDGAPGYFGTDGVRFATVTYVRGRYVFELILTSTSGAPKQERSLAETAAKAFPDKP